MQDRPVPLCPSLWHRASCGPKSRWTEVGRDFSRSKCSRIALFWPDKDGCISKTIDYIWIKKKIFNIQWMDRNGCRWMNKTRFWDSNTYWRGFFFKWFSAVQITSQFRGCYCLGVWGITYHQPTSQLPKSECRNAPLKPKLALEVEKWLNRTS